MGILNNNVQKTDDDIIKEKYAKLVSETTRMHRILKGRQNAIFDYLWENDVDTVQRILDLYGPEAANLFIASEMIKQVLNFVEPGSFDKSPQHGYEIHEDGTVTINNLSSSSSSESSPSSVSSESSSTN